MTSTLRLLVVSSLYDRPGSFTGGHVHRLCRELVRSGVTTSVLCPLARFDRGRGLANLKRLTDRSRSTVLDGVEVAYLPYANMPQAISPALEAHLLYRRLTRAVADDPAVFDVVHAHRLFPTGDATLTLARNLGVPIIVSARGSDVHTHPLRHERIRSRTARVIAEADHVTAVSRALADQVADIATPTRPVRVVYNGVDSRQFTPTENPVEARRELGLPEGGPGFITVARLDAAKGVFDLLAAFPGVAREHPESWLAFVGDGPALEELRRRAAAAGIEDRVRIAGAEPHARVPRWLAAADVFVLASRAEGLPNVILEAMSCGLPVVATRAGGTEEAVGQTGLLLEPGDPEALKRAMERLAGDPEECRALGAEARRRVLEKFDWSRCAAQMLNLYRESLERREA